MVPVEVPSRPPRLPGALSVSGPVAKVVTNTRANVNVRDKYKYNNTRSEFLPHKSLRFLFHATRLSFNAYFPYTLKSSVAFPRDMPSTTSDRKVQSRIKATNVARAARANSESSDTSPERGERIEDTGSGPEDLDQPWPYEFKVPSRDPRLRHSTS